jgi:hypothetical protein
MDRNPIIINKPKNIQRLLQMMDQLTKMKETGKRNGEKTRNLNNSRTQKKLVLMFTICNTFQ